MKETAKTLKIFFWLDIVVSLLMVVLFECDILPQGGLADNKEAEFLISSVMIVLTLVAIPLALKLFKMKKVDEQLHVSDEWLRNANLKKWGVLRIGILGDTLVANTLFYYLFIRPSFFYLAILLLLAMAFIYPTVDRCERETDISEEEPMADDEGEIDGTSEGESESDDKIDSETDDHKN